MSGKNPQWYSDRGPQCPYKLKITDDEADGDDDVFEDGNNEADNGGGDKDIEEVGDGVPVKKKF